MASKAKKWIKGSLIGLGVVMVLFIGTAIAVPFLFKDQILAKVKEEANKQLNATMDFKDVGLSLLWTFPNLSFSLKGLTITGKEEFEGLKLCDIENFSIRLNIMDVIGGKYVINGLVIDKPQFYVKVLNNGKANYDITKPDSTAKKEDPKAAEPTEFKLKLDYYAINNAEITYDDAPNNTYMKLVNLTHKGSGNMTASVYDFFTRTTIDAMTLSYDRITYFNKTKLDAKLNVNVDMDKMKFVLLDNSIKLNAFELKADGDVEMPGNDIKMNLNFSTPSTSFASVLSLIPSAFTKDFSNVKTKGTFNFAAKVNGTYNEKTYPAFSVNLAVADAEFQYPDLPMAVKDINTKILVSSPSSNLDNMTVDISKFHMLLGTNPFDAVLKLKTPMSDPDVDTKIDGKINLGDLAKAFPMEGVRGMTGNIEAHLQAKTKMSYVEKQQYDKVDMKGLLTIANFIFLADGSPDVNLKNMKMEFTPNNVNLEDLDLKIGKSDIRANGKLDNILTYFSRDKVMQGSLNVKSVLLDLNEMMGTDTTTTSSSSGATATTMVDTTTASDEKVFDRWDFAANFECQKMIYDVYEIKGLKTAGSFSPSKAKLDNFEMKMGEMDLQAEGELTNIFGYLYDNEVLNGRLKMHSNYMNLNQFMAEDGKATEPAPAATPADPAKVESAYEPILVPANLNFSLIATMSTLIYDTYKLRNVKSEMRIMDERLIIVNMSADAFGGRMAINGEYNTKKHDEPKFVFGYDVAQLDIQEIAKGVPLASYFLPIIKQMTGRFDSQFKVSGILDKNLYPVLGSLNAEGLMATYDAMVQSMPGLQQALDKWMDKKGLERLSVANTKNFFKIENGKFKVDPFAFNAKGIDMTFGGSHGLDQIMDYKLKMRVPRAMLNQSPVGAAANAGASKGFAALQGEAKKLNINIEEAEFLNFGVDIGGPLSKPTFAPKLLGAEGKGGKSLGDQAKESLKEEANKIKDQAEAKVKEEANKLKDEAEARARAEAERLAKEAEDKAKKEADRLVQQAKNSEDAKRIRDSLDQVAKKAKEDLLKDVKNPIKDVKNPFKKDK